MNKIDLAKTKVSSIFPWWKYKFLGGNYRLADFLLYLFGLKQIFSLFLRLN